MTDETSSVMDKRLIGYWRAENHVGPSFVVGRVEGKDNVTEIVGVGLDDGGGAVIQRWPLFATRIGEVPYLSVRLPEWPYTISRYEFVDDETVRIYDADVGAFVRAVEEGQLRGEIKGTGLSVHVTASPQELVAYLAASWPGAFKMREGTYRRVRLQ